MWRRFLQGWLPPHYEIGTRKYLVLEEPVDGSIYSSEVDLVVFHPAYPKQLRERSEVLVSGVVAAFSVKGQLKVSDLRAAIEEARRVRRGIGIRHGKVIGELRSPLVYGVLANTHQLRRSAGEKTLDLLQTSAEDSGVHPREMLDIVCIADVDCWTREGTASRTASAESYVDLWMGTSGSPEATHAVPVASLVTALWAKLAARDPELDPIAHGLHRTRTAGTTSGAGLGRPMDGLISHELMLQIFEDSARFELNA
ncbi:hypothetical protein GCM10010409_50610 [Mycolicibacterium diernhoferi]